MGLVQTVLVQLGSISHGRKPPHLEQQQQYQQESNQQRLNEQSQNQKCVDMSQPGPHF